MLITMRLPRAAAAKMEVPVEADADEVEVTLPAIELAGRMTLATGHPIGPQDLETYCATLEIDRSHDDARVESDRRDPEMRRGTTRSPRRATLAIDEGAVVEWVSGVLTECYF